MLQYPYITHSLADCVAQQLQHPQSKWVVTDRVNNKQRKFRCFQNQSVIALHARLYCHTARASQRHETSLQKCNLPKATTKSKFYREKWQTVDIIMNQSEIAFSQVKSECHEITTGWQGMFSRLVWFVVPPRPRAIDSFFYYFVQKKIRS